MKFVIVSLIASCAAAASGLYIDHGDHLLLNVPTKSTLTKSSQIVNHGSTLIHAPIVPLYASHIDAPRKTTITKSNQIVNHGGTAVLHAKVPVYHTAEVDIPVSKIETNAIDLKDGYHQIHTSVHNHAYEPLHIIHHGQVIDHEPLVLTHSNHAALAYDAVHLHAPVASYKSGDSAVSHHSSTVHETVPVVHSLPYYLHH